MIPLLSTTVIPIQRLQHHDGRSDYRVLMIKRASTLRVLPGFWVFPGGIVEPVDVQKSRILQDGSHATTVLRQIGVPDGLNWTDAGWPADVSPLTINREVAAYSLINAGMRELEEETGLSGSFNEPWSSVRYFGRRVTPTLFKYRFDTHYFLFELDNAGPLLTSSAEVEQARWFSPDEWQYELKQLPNVEFRIAPPTVDALHALSEYVYLSDLLAHGMMSEQVNDPDRLASFQNLLADSI